MAEPVIPEPHKTYVLELLAALGPAAEDFVVVGAQAMKFCVEGARATRDFDFVLDAVHLREVDVPLRSRLEGLGYTVVETARNFQFEKPIPNSLEQMRIELMAPDELQRPNDYRVDVQHGVHARACAGGHVALVESDPHMISGRLPAGAAFQGTLRVVRAHALVLLKLLALDDRYRNIRGPHESRHDRDEAGIHAADIVAIVSAQSNVPRFRNAFQAQFQNDLLLGMRVMRIADGYFRHDTSPGLLVYEEHHASQPSYVGIQRQELRGEIRRAHSAMGTVLPSRGFVSFGAAVDDSCEIGSPLAQEFLSALEQYRIHIDDPGALQFLPSTALGGAHARGERSVTNASQAFAALTEVERGLVRALLQRHAARLRAEEALRVAFPRALSHERADVDPPGAGNGR